MQEQSQTAPSPPGASPTGSHVLVSLVVVAAIVLGASACAGTGRPTAGEWASAWQQATGTIPSLEKLGEPPDRSLCSQALGELRAMQPDLVPTPDPALDAVVAEWTRIAEDVMFECPPRSTDLPSLAVAYGELARLQVGIDAVLEIDLLAE